jgi:hypothetical protein
VHLRVFGLARTARVHAWDSSAIQFRVAFLFDMDKEGGGGMPTHAGYAVFFMCAIPEGFPKDQPELRLQSTVCPRARKPATYT